MAGQSVLIFPEGTWNITENLLMLPLHWGIIEIAQRANAAIVPVILDYHSDSCFYSIGREMRVDQEKTKKQMILELRDTMVAMRFEIWESKPLTARNGYTKEQFDKIIQKSLAEYPLLDVEFENSVIRKEK